jgi:MFS family permease
VLVQARRRAAETTAVPGGTSAVPAAGATAVPTGTAEERAAAAALWWRAGMAVTAVAWGAQQFAPLLLLYQDRLHLGATVVQSTFGCYVGGLIPGLLLGGPVSDQYGRKPVLVPTLFASLVATGALMLGGAGVGWLFAGRVLAGIASGAAFSSGAAWIKEMSLSPDPAVNPGPRRLTIAMSLGFGVGPLVSGLLAQWAPAPTVVPYLPHVLLTLVAIPLAVRTPETRQRRARPSARVPEVPRSRSVRVPEVPRAREPRAWQSMRVPEVRLRRFRTVVLPLAPWVFGSAGVAVGYLPGLVRSHLGGYPYAFSATVTILTAGTGIAVQGLARRLDRLGGSRLLVTSLGVMTAGMALAALGADLVQPAVVLVAAVVLGAGYGMCQVCGLLEVQRMAAPARLAGLTAVYQAATYVGFVVSVPLAALDRYAAPAVLLLVLAGLSALTLVATRIAAAR